MTEPFRDSHGPGEDALRSALSDTEQALSAEQPPVADWAGLVRRRVGVRRRNRQAAGAGAGALLVAAAAAGVLYAAPAGETESLVAVAPTVSAAPTPSAASDPSPVAEASSAASPQPTAEASPPAPAPAPAATAEPSSAAATSPAPAPARQQPPPAPSYPPSGRQDIEITARVSNDRPRAGEQITVDVEATGRAETPPDLQGPQIDDEPYPWAPSSCTERPAGQSPPPARPQSTRMTVQHTFDTPGRHTLTFRADSACSYYQGFDELVVVVDVQPAP